MAGVSIQVDLHELLAFAERAQVMPIVAYEAAAKVVAQTTKDVRNTAQDLAPVLTGELQGSIEGESAGLTGRVWTDLRYAPYVEFGTYKDRPQPFMDPAAEMHDGQFGINLEIAVCAAIEAVL